MLAPIENRASMLGPARFEWWPDWRGRSVAIVACGPSAKAAGVDSLRGAMPVVAIKEAAVDLCPWADVVYGCDLPWWVHRRGMPKFNGLKLCWDKNVCTQFPDVRPVEIKEVYRSGADVRYLNAFALDEPGVIGSGHHSGFQALNLAIQFGAKRILLIGLDLNEQGGAHYYGRNNWFRASNPDIHQFERCIRALQASASILPLLGVEIVNASLSSSVWAFPKMTVTDTLRDWNISG